MEGEGEEKKSVYSVWAIPPADVQERMKKVMKSLSSKFDGPECEPHVTVIGAMELTESDALLKFKSAREDLKAYTANVKSVSTGTFFYQCVYLLLHPTPEVNETDVHCWNHFGYNSSNERGVADASGTPVMNPDNSVNSDDIGKGRRKKTRSAAAAAATAVVPAEMPSMDLDLPVDPNEPTYCLQPS